MIRERDQFLWFCLPFRIIFVPEECLFASEGSSEESVTDQESPSESLKLSDIHGQFSQSYEEDSLRAVDHHHHQQQQQQNQPETQPSEAKDENLS